MGVWHFDGFGLLDSVEQQRNHHHRNPLPPKNGTLRFWQFWTEEQKLENLPNPRPHLRKLLQRLCCVRSYRLVAFLMKFRKLVSVAFKKFWGRRLWELYTPFQNVPKITFMCEKGNIINISASRNNKYQSEYRKLVVVTFTQVLLWSDRWALRQLVRSTRNETTENKRFPKEQNRQQISEEREQIVTHHHAKCKWNEMSIQATWRHFKNETSV